MSAGFPLLANLVFPEVDAIRYAFIGPLVGALSRAGSGWLADRAGGALVTFWVLIVQMVATAGMVWSLAAHSFPLFFTMVLLLFFVSGVGNASTFQRSEEHTSELQSIMRISYSVLCLTKTKQ